MRAGILRLLPLPVNGCHFNDCAYFLYLFKATYLQLIQYFKRLKQI